MASSLYKTIGIVLSRRDHKEVDRGYSVFTRDHGKVEFLARGGHKPLAKLTPHLEMMAEVDLLIVRGKVYQTVAGVDRLRSFPNIYGDLSLLLLAQNALHLVDIGTKPHEQDSFLYDQLLSWLEFLNSIEAATPSPPDRTENKSVVRADNSHLGRGRTFSPERSGYLLGSFALKLLAITGYRPELQRCLACELSIEPGSYRWHALKGGVVCKDCAIKDEQQWFSARPMSDDVLKLLRFAMSEKFEDQLRPNLPGKTLLEFHEAIESLIVSHFPTIPASSLRAACLV